MTRLLDALKLNWISIDTNTNQKDQNLNQLIVVSLRNKRDLDKEHEIPQTCRKIVEDASVPLEIDESAKLTKVVIQQAHVDKGENKETEQVPAKVPQKVLEQENAQVNEKK